MFTMSPVSGAVPFRRDLGVGTPVVVGSMLIMGAKVARDSWVLVRFITRIFNCRSSLFPNHSRHRSCFLFSRLITIQVGMWPNSWHGAANRRPPESGVDLGKAAEKQVHGCLEMVSLPVLCFLFVFDNL